MKVLVKIYPASIMSLLIAIFCFTFSSQKNKDLIISKDVIVDLMNHLENQYLDLSPETSKNNVLDEPNSTTSFNFDRPRTLATLKLFLDHYFPNRTEDLKNAEMLLKEIVEHKITFPDLVEGYEKTKRFHSQIDDKIIELGTRKEILTQNQIVRQGILDLYFDSYWEKRKKYQWQKPLLELKERIRKDIKEGTL